MTVEVTGIAAMMKRLHTVEGETAQGTERGLVVAAIKLLRLSQLVVPVDTNLLRSSGFVDKQGSGFRTRVSVGYTAPYAIFVHENLEAHHAQGKIAKFLEKPMRDNLVLLQATIREEAQDRRKRGMPQLNSPATLGTHALVPAMPKAPGSYLQQVGGGRVTYVSGRGWRRAK